MAAVRTAARRVCLRWPTPDHTRRGEAVMGQLIDEIITLLALGGTRHPKE
jgi:hypothetical protein